VKYWAGYKIFILPNYTISIPQYLYDNDPSYRNSKIENLNRTTWAQFSGELSKSSIMKLRYAISLLNLISKPKKVINPTTNKYYTFKINFITLTLPAAQGELSDQYIKSKCLNNFLIQCKNKFGMKDYIWKAETQDNDNIHFHITTNVYIEHEKLKNLWNKILNNTDLIKQFYNKNNHYCPNSTDIHSVKNIVNYESYMIKYFCKNEKNKRKVKGKIWDCSNSLNYTNRLCIDNPDISYEVNEHLSSNYHSVAIAKDYCTIYPVTFENLYKSGNTNISKHLNSWMEKIKEF
jgi:hypothetical protein